MTNHHDDDIRGPRPREEPRWRSSERSVRVCTRSSPTYRQVVTGEAGEGELERGRTMSCSPSRSGQERDILTHTYDEWERRRSRSPPRHSDRSKVEQMAACAPQQEDRAFEESQELRPSAYQPPAPAKSLECRLASSSLATGIVSGQAEGMVLEQVDVRRPLSSSPSIGVALEQVQGEVLVGLGVQLPVDTQVDDISNSVTHMDFDTSTGSGMILEQIDGTVGYEDEGEQTKVLGVVEDEEIEMEEGGGKAIFKDAAPPLLPRSATAPRRGGRGHKRIMVATRSRLAARPSPVPVSMRAQRKLMKELQFMDLSSQPPDAAVTTYIDQYGQDLPAKAVDTIRADARLGNKKLAKALTAIAAEAGSAEMEFP